MAVARQVFYPTQIDDGNSPDIPGVVSVFHNDRGERFIMSMPPEAALRHAENLKAEAKKALAKAVRNSAMMMRERPARLDG